MLTAKEKVIRHRIANKKYRQTEKGRISQAVGHKKYRSTMKGKITSRKSVRKYRCSEKGKNKMKSYRQSEQGKNIRAKWAKSKKGTTSISKYQQSEKCKTKDRKHRDKRNRNLGWMLMFLNPFDDSTLVDYHHITDTYVVAVPRDLHRLYLGKYHREKVMDIVKQIYLKEE